MEQSQVKSSRIFIKGGEEAARSYIVANNTEQELWDAEEPIIYIKTTDLSGRYSLKILDYTIRDPEPELSSDDISSLRSEINELKGMINQLMQNNRQTYSQKGGHR